MPTVAPSAIREAIGQQRTVPHSVAALLRAICSQIYHAADSGDTAHLVELADDIAANGTMWSGALTQNTPAAAQVDSMAMDHTLIPIGMTDTFATPGTLRGAAADKAVDEKAAADQAAANKAVAEKEAAAAADKAAADKTAADAQRAANERNSEADKARADQQQRVAADQKAAADRARETPTERMSD
jgi:hypothetical protein